MQGEQGHGEASVLPDCPGRVAHRSHALVQAPGGRSAKERACMISKDRITTVQWALLGALVGVILGGLMAGLTFH
jgi:hypothetical protein